MAFPRERMVQLLLLLHYLNSVHTDNEPYMPPAWDTLWCEAKNIVREAKRQLRVMEIQAPVREMVTD